MRHAWSAAALLVLSAGLRLRVGEAAEPATKQVVDAEYPAEFRARVNAEVERGARQMLTALEAVADKSLGTSEEHAVGERALVLLTLLKCGIPRDSPALETAFTRVRARSPRGTYDVGVVLMALAARYDDAMDPFALDVVDKDGRHVVPPPTRRTLDPADTSWLEAGVRYLVSHQREDTWRRYLRPALPEPPSKSEKKPRRGEKPEPKPQPPRGWGYPGGFSSGDQDWMDVSCTQYALLGLKAAARCGIAVKPETWAATLELLLSWQDESGPTVDFLGNEVRGGNRLEWTESAAARGFNYSGTVHRHKCTGGRTVAGAAGMMICQSELWGSPAFPPSLERRARLGIRDALAWMQANYAVDKNPGERPVEAVLKDLPGAPKLPAGLALSDPLYGAYLYGLERMGVLAHMRLLGTHDWYLEGAEHILAMRAKRGSSYHSETDECFELLFLRRASFRTALPAITPGDTPLPTPAPAPPAPAEPPAMPPAKPPEGPPAR